MKKLNKRILALALCFCVLAALFIPLSVSAENDEQTAKNNLISAWTALAADSKTEKVVIATPNASTNDADGNPKLRTEVTAQTTVAGLTDVSVLGPYYMDKIKFTQGDSTSSRGWNYIVGFSTVDSTIKLKDFSTIYFYAASFNGASHCSVNMTLQIDNGNTLTSYPYTNGASWRKITISPTKDAIGAGFKFLVNSGSTLTHMSFGSIIGEKSIAGPALPADYVNMSLFELITAANEIDYEGYSTSDDFKNALNAAKSLFSEEDVKYNELVAAWKALSTETKVVKDVLAVPSTTLLDADGAAHNFITVDANTAINGITDNSVLGTHYVDRIKVTKGTSTASLDSKYVITFSTVDNNVKLKDYTSIYFYAVTYNGTAIKNVGLTYQIDHGTNKTGYPWTQASGWAKISMSASADKIGAGFKFWINSSQTLTHMSFGSVIGERNVTGPALPTGYEDMSLLELVSAAKDVDTSGFPSTANFNAVLADAIAALDPEEYAFSELVAAWKAINSEEKVGKEVIAVPNEQLTDADAASVNRTEIKADTVVPDFTLDKSLLGTYFVNKLKFAKGSTAASLGWNFIIKFKTVDKNVKLTEYSDIYFYAISYNGASTCSVGMTYQIDDGNNALGYPWTTSTNWTKISLAPTKDAIGNGIKFLVNGGETITHMSFGSVIGEKIMKGAPLPNGYGKMSISALVAAAKAIDYQGFASSNRFIAALNNAETFADNSAELRQKLDTAWKNIGIRYYEEIAVPSETYVGSDGATYNRTEISDATTIADLADKTLLGSFYVNKLAVSAPNSSQSLGWNYVINFTTVKKETQLLKYDMVYFYANAYNGNNTVPVRITTQINNGGNCTNYGETNGVGWTKLSMTPTSNAIGSGFKFAVEPEQNVTNVSFGSVFGSYVVKPEYPENADKLSFIEFVAVADNCDMTGFDATEFNAALDECKALIENRRKAVTDVLTAASQTLPDNVDALSVQELVAAARAYDIENKTQRSNLGRAIWMLNLLTDEGPVLDALVGAWKVIATLPEDQYYLTAEEWFAAAENVDLTAADDVDKASFEAAVAVLKDFLTKGNSDITKLSDLVTKANTMNYYDFTGASWADFSNARDAAVAVISDYAKVTQKTVNAACDELLAAWGNLKMYVRTQWFDYMEYFLQTDPQMRLTYTGKNTETSCIAEKASVPNGANAAVVVTNQQTGWNHVINASGVDLTNISKNELVELWFKADKANNTMSQLNLQFMTASGVTYYTAEIDLPLDVRDGEWHRIEVPLTAFKSIDYKSNITEDGAFVANQIRLVSTVGVGSYSLANIAVVTTEDVEAGVVPNVPKMKINERKEVIYEPPKNPFTGVDRGDPWGWEEKKKNPLKDNATEEETNNSDNSSTENTEPVLVAEGECGDSVTWKFYDDGKLVIEGTGKMSDYEEVAPWIAANCDVLSVSISDGITSIGDSAFYGCASLTEITIPDSVTRIGMFAFYECDNLKSVKLSSKVKEIGAYAFGFVYNAETATAKLVDGFKLFVEDPSEALTYAKTYEVPYEIYSSNKTADVAPAATNNLWIWILVGAVALLIVAFVVVVLIVIKNRKNTVKGAK